ncbi:MAG: hypothetical protein GEU87_14795 [Alphaproteobacteria bacterium]|nr:hypothetical protein [Alphaproteobacteria bacterium]
MSRNALYLLLLFGASAIFAPIAPARADRDIQAEETDETINKTVKSLNRTERSEEKARSRQKVLEQQHDELEFRRRTGAPFRSERAIRNDLNRNELRQGWEKREGRRLDYEITRQKNDLRNQTNDWQRR